MGKKIISKVGSIPQEITFHMIKNLILFSCIVLASHAGQAQGFRAGAVLGGNMSQINGDFIAGFNKLGIHGGLKVSRSINDKIEASVELLYSERGSRSSLRDINLLKIKLNYVEIPVIVAYKDWLRDDYYKMHFETGFSFGRLLQHSIEDVGGVLSVDQIRDTDFSFLAGVTFFSTERMGFTLRYTQSINLLIDQKANPNFARLRGYFITFRTIYFL